MKLKMKSCQRQRLATENEYFTSKETNFLLFLKHIRADACISYDPTMHIIAYKDSTGDWDTLWSDLDWEIMLDEAISKDIPRIKIYLKPQVPSKYTGMNLSRSLPNTFHR